MKKNSKSLHTLSTVARSVTMLGSCMMGVHASFANQNDYYDAMMDVMDGSAGGSIAPSYGGTVQVAGTSIGQSVLISVTVTCPAISNHFGCVGAIFPAASGGTIEAQLSYQNFCTGGVTATTDIGNITCSSSGSVYNINFSCVNFTTQKAMNNNTTTASFTCS